MARGERRIVSGPLALEIARTKAELGMRNRSVPIDASTQILMKTKRNQLVVRRRGRGGPRITSRRAEGLANCKGKRAGEFVRCVQGALGRAPSVLTVRYMGAGARAAA